MLTVPRFALLLLLPLLFAACAQGEATPDTEDDFPLPGNNANPGNNQPVACPPNACTPGENICVGLDQVFVCEVLESGCPAFSLAETCTNTLRCVEGRCALEDSCIDEDQDGYGDGCEFGPDCDDSDPERYDNGVERCDNKDNDCDGLIDEDDVCASTCPQQPCVPGSRECASGNSIRECIRDAEGCGQWAAEVPCGDSCQNGACNGCDDPDGDQRGPGCPLGGDCDQADPDRYEGADEVCDGLDNDCDNLVDEAFPDLGEPCNAGQGACTHEGRKICSPGGTSTQCDASPRDPTPEICGDNIDNDCDNRVDEGFDFQGLPCSEGLGACFRPGVFACDGGTEIRCNAVAGNPSEEICDGIDNDCDGQTDEGGICVVCSGENDQSPNATSLPRGQRASSAICAQSEIDWFSLGTYNRGETIHIDLVPENGDNNFRFELYTSDFLTSSISDNPRTNITFRATSSRTHYIRVHYNGNLGDAKGYTLQHR